MTKNIIYIFLLTIGICKAQNNFGIKLSGGISKISNTLLDLDNITESSGKEYSPSINIGLFYKHQVLRKV